MATRPECGWPVRWFRVDAGQFLSGLGGDGIECGIVELALDADTLQPLQFVGNQQFAVNIALIFYLDFGSLHHLALALR